MSAYINEFSKQFLLTPTFTFGLFLLVSILFFVFFYYLLNFPTSIIGEKQDLNLEKYI